ncbi:hypothetical protein TSOC_013268 [Tetrabaena socialis]|uniref:Uncharacterized protein n=1 Tax=Tetrabaena socialis TaxID=47790 RepID=A0A2J7ZKT9_9CHLO|nr:hypothetical protein TSOC_013268 [Tetrabaena socialis]|eukprot:PNH00883.1 hypothetical protein TSOC_013268 [Tetrabaena socialis]
MRMGNEFRGATARRGVSWERHFNRTTLYLPGICQCQCQCQCQAALMGIFPALPKLRYALDALDPAAVTLTPQLQPASVGVAEYAY